MNFQTIILIPPSGELKKQDFSLQRIALWLKQFSNISITLLHVKNEKFSLDLSMFPTIIEVESKEEIIEKLKTLEYDLIFHRSWMTAYSFAAQLVKLFDKVVINIKDWNFANKEVYDFLYPGFNDHESMEYIFRNAYKIVSHFTHEQAELWAKEYGVDKKKFVFFPEFCNQFFDNKKKKYDKNKIRLTYAGAIPSTSQPEDYFPGKAHLRSIKRLTKQGIYIDFVLPELVYETMRNSKDAFFDFLYEAEINKRFQLVKGKSLDAEILHEYDFGFFELEASGVNHDLYKYAITSKFAFYLEAGLPMLVNKKFVSMSKLVKKYGLGIVFDNDDLSHLKEKLNVKQYEYSEFIENIKRYRKKYVYNKKHLKKMGIDI